LKRLLIGTITKVVPTSISVYWVKQAGREEEEEECKVEARRL